MTAWVADWAVAGWVMIVVLVLMHTGCQSAGLQTTALAHAHGTLEGPTTPEAAAEWQGRKKPVPAEERSEEAAARDAEQEASTAAEGEAPDETTEGEPTAPPEPPATPVDIAKLFRENAAQLLRMSWQTRTRLQVRGTEVLEVLHKVQFDQNGDLKRRVLSSRRRTSATVSADEAAAADWEADTEMLSDLIHAYTVTSMGSVSRSVDGQQATLHVGGKRTVTGSDAMIPGDTVTIELNPAKQLEALRIETTVAENPVSAEVFYRKLPHGPAYPARAQIQMPARDLQATVESFSFRAF